MSNKLITESYSRDLGTGVRKSIMLLMADKASDDGRGIYASKQTMAEELCWSKRVVQQTIAGLVTDGLLIISGSHPCRFGSTVEYAIDVDRLQSLPLVPSAAKAKAEKDRKEAEKLRASKEDETSPPKGGAPRSPVTIKRGEPHAPRGEPHAPKPPLEPLETPLPPQTGGKKKRFIISDDWTVPDLERLTDNAKAYAAQWPTGAYGSQAETFANWHRGKGTRSADWAALWASWVGNNHEAVMRRAKAGIGYPVANPSRSAGTAPATPKLPSAAKVDEDARSAKLHDALRGIIGQTSWEVWFSTAALIIDVDQLTVVAVSDFARDRIERDYAASIQKAIGQLGWHIEHIRHTVSAPKRKAA